MTRELMIILNCFSFSIVLTVAVADVTGFSVGYALGLDCLIWLAFCFGCYFQRWKGPA